MSVSIKSAEEIDKMAHAGALAAKTLQLMQSLVEPGVSTGWLDTQAHEFILAHHAIPAPLNYRGFPKSICTSINHQVCHGIPSDERQLKDGDIVNIDVTVILDGYHGDSSLMVQVGKTEVKAQRICQIAHECLWHGIAQVKPGNTFKHIARAIEKHAHAQRCSVVEEYCGHGIGKAFHEEPQILHYVAPNEAVQDMVLVPGMTFTIEPMINLGKKAVKVLGDDWTVVTRDRSLSAQWEHTMAVTESGVRVLTLRDDETPLFLSREAVSA